MKIKKSKLRQLIQEAINTWHKNFYTDYNDPFGVEDQSGMDLDIDQYANSDGSWSVQIHCGFDETLSEPLRVFKTEDDAGAYVRRKEDDIYRSYINSGQL